MLGEKNKKINAQVGKRIKFKYGRVAHQNLKIISSQVQPYGTRSGTAWQIRITLVWIQDLEPTNH